MSLARLLSSAAATVTVLAAAACGPSGPATSTSAGTCPAAPVTVVVTTNVWGNIAEQLAGDCAAVNTIISNPSGDPHDFQPSAATSAAFAQADLAVVNGLGYDAWATQIIASLGSQAPPVINLGDVVGLSTGANPHIWYSPAFVVRSAAAVTAALKQARSQASASFDAAAAQFATAMKPYLDQVAAVKGRFAGAPVGATESIFAYMAQATGLDLTTPADYLTAEEPSAQAIAAFRQQISSKSIRALIYNTQTEGGLPTGMRTLADQAGIPVVDITETLTPAGSSFQDWQIRQLQSLATALGQTP